MGPTSGFRKPRALETLGDRLDERSRRVLSGPLNIVDLGLGEASQSRFEC